MESPKTDPPPTGTGTGPRPAASGRPWRALLLVLLIGGAVAWVSFRMQADSSGAFNPTLHWQTDSDQALDRAAREGLPVLMVFTGPRCIYCRRLEKLVLERPPFEKAVAGRVVLALLDIESVKHLRLLEGFGGSATPTVVLTDPAGRMLGFYQGDGADLADWVGRMLRDWRGEGRAATQPEAGATTRGE